MENKELNQKVKGIPNLPKLRVDIFSKDKDVQDKYLLLIALTFRIKPDIISEMFNYPANYLFDYAYASDNEMYYRAFKVLNAEDGINQKRAVIKLINFYNEYVNSYNNYVKDKKNKNIENVNKDIENIKTLKRKLNDYDAYELMQSGRESGDKITEESLKIMINYRLKYGLTSKEISELFHVNGNNFREISTNYLADKPELKTRWVSLNDYYNDYFLTHGSGRK